MIYLFTMLTSYTNHYDIEHVRRACVCTENVADKPVLKLMDRDCFISTQI